MKKFKMQKALYVKYNCDGDTKDFKRCSFWYVNEYNRTLGKLDEGITISLSGSDRADEGGESIFLSLNNIKKCLKQKGISIC